jgi:replicative DNA helicase
MHYSPKNEQIVLGTCLRYRDVLEKLSTNKDLTFVVEAHQIIWGGLQTLLERRLKYTPGTLESILPPEGWQGKKYLEKLYRMAERENYEFHLERMAWDQVRVDLFRDDVAQLTNLLKDATASPAEARRFVKTIDTKLTEMHDESPIARNDHLIAKAQATFRARRIAGPNFRGSGFEAIDRELDEGFANHRISALAATPSTGKTAGMLNIAKRQALHNDIKVGILAWEGGMQSAIDLMCASELKIPLPKILKFAKRITDEEQERIDDFIDTLLGNDNLKFLKPPPKRLYRGAPWDVTRRVLDWVEEQFSKWDRDVIYWDLFLKKLPSSTPEMVTQALDRVQDIK